MRLSSYFETITITFGDVGENGPGMEKIGSLSENGGFTVEELRDAKRKLEESGFQCELLDLKDALPEEDKDYAQKAALLIVNGMLEENNLSTSLFKEQKSLDWDKKAKIYGRVVNKNARWNLCYADHPQEPNYEKGKGRIIGWNDVPMLNALRNKFLKYFPQEKVSNLVAEGNRYYDLKKTYIGWHGDKERRIVIAARLGATFPLKYQWYLNGKSVGQIIELSLKHGSVYVMSDKAVGWDCEKNGYTLRHCAGYQQNKK